MAIADLEVKTWSSVVDIMKESLGTWCYYNNSPITIPEIDCNRTSLV